MTYIAVITTTDRDGTKHERRVECPGVSTNPHARKKQCTKCHGTMGEMIRGYEAGKKWNREHK